MAQHKRINSLSHLAKSGFRFSILMLVMTFAFTATAQTPYPGCPNVSQTPDDPTLTLSNDTLYLHCNQTCADLEATFLQTGATDTYKVESVPYAPPFPATGGTALFVNSDDKFSSTIDLPFDFCFYGNSYNEVVVGANGMLSFDVSKDGAGNCYILDNPIPNATNANNCNGLVASGNGNMLWNSIYGPFLDLDPSVKNPAPSINYAILGSAPCRTFVLNYTNVAQYSCNNLRSTQQIVLYETTSVIEIYVKDRDICTGWNGGRAVIGIQNINGTKATVPPGRNTGQWTAKNEAWRFTPDGAPNFTLKWFDEDNNFISSNPNIQVCVPDPTVSSKYKVEVEYTICDGSKILVEDFINLVAREELTADFETKSSRCFESCDGSAKINVLTGDGPFTYTWPNGVVNNTNFVDTLCKGNYTIKVEDIYGCEEDFNFSVDEPTKLTTTTSSEVVSCYGLLDGTGEVVANGGVLPYSITWSNSDIGTTMTDGAGKYYVTVTDDSLCVAIDSVLITEPDELVFDTNITALTCPVEKDGAIEFIPSGGNPPYQYSIDDGANYSGSPNFNNLASGNYKLRLKDDKDCEYAFEVFVPQGTISLTGPNDTTICKGSDITFTATGDYSTLSWDQGIQNGVSFTPDFEGSKTYTVTVQNEGGCELTHEVILTVEPVYDPSINPAGPYCANADDEQLITASPGGTWSGTGVSPTGLFSPSTAGEGSHVITYSFNGFCPTSSSITIGINNTFDAAIDPVSPICELNSSIKLTSVTPGGKWYGTGMVDVTDSLQSDFDPALAGAGKHWVFHEVFGTCGDLDSLEIEVIAAEIAAIDATPEFCPTGTGANLTATPAGGTFTGPGIIGTDYFDPTLTGSGSFKVYYTPSSACRVIDSAIVVVVDTLKGIPDTILVSCFADQTSITTLVTGGKQPLSYNWSTSPSTTGATANNLSVGDHPVIVTDDLGCSITLNHRVDEPTQLILTAQADTTPASCGGYFDGTVTFHPTGGTSVSGVYNYALSPNNGVFNGSSGFTNLPSGLYTATISDDNGCSITENFEIKEPTPIYLTASHIDEYCGLANGSISVSSVSGGVSATGNYIYSWAHGPTTKDLSNLSSGSYILTITDDNSCTKDTTIIISNGAGFALDLDTIPVTCFNGNDGKAFVKSIIGGTPGATYTYNWDNGSATDTAFNLTIGTYSVTVTDDQNCPTTASVTVTQPTEVTITSVGDSLLCDGETYTTTFTGNNGNGGPYTYTANAGTVTGNSFTTDAPGTYTIFATDSKGCISQNTNFIISYRDPLAISVNGIPSACPGDVVTLNATATGGTASYNYDWNNGSFSGQSINYTTNSDGKNDTINVVLNDGCSLPDTAYYIITFNNIPQLDPTFTPSEGCEALTIGVHLSGDASMYQSLIWDMGDNQTVQNQFDFQHTYINNGNYTVSIDAITAEGCNIQGTWTDTIKVYPLPYGEIKQNPSRITVISNHGLFTVSGSGNIADIQWDLSKSGINIHSENSLRLDYDFEGDSATYRLNALLISDKGCLQNIDHVFKVYPEQKMYIPNAFTPNGDGVNDVFSISSFGVSLDEFEVIIYDRWGEIIFTSDQLDFKWDGTYRNEEVSSGVYAFKILYNDGVPKKVLIGGKVTLLR